MSRAVQEVHSEESSSDGNARAAAPNDRTYTAILSDRHRWHAEHDAARVELETARREAVRRKHEASERAKRELQLEEDAAAARERAKRKQRAHELEGADRMLAMHVRRAQTLPPADRWTPLWRPASGPLPEEPEASDERQRSYRLPVRQKVRFNSTYSTVCVFVCLCTARRHVYPSCNIASRDELQISDSFESRGAASDCSLVRLSEHSVCCPVLPLVYNVQFTAQAVVCGQFRSDARLHAFCACRRERGH